MPPVACIILAAGQGTRMKSDLPKVLHPVAGTPMIAHVLNACADLLPEQIVVVTAPDATEIEKAVAPQRCAVQAKPLGTGDAVKAARMALAGFTGDIIILFADGPLITADSLRALRRKRAETSAAIVVAGFSPEDPAANGRLVLDDQGRLAAIVELLDATPEQRAIRLCNGGAMLFDAAALWPLLDKLRDDNAKKEFYLTDCIALARAAGDDCAVAELPADEVYCVNNRVELAQAEKLMQRRLRERAMLGGATMTDPDSVFLSMDTKIGRDVTIGPNVVFGPGVDIGDRADIRAFCHIEQARIDAGAVIGPFARIRPGSTVGAGAHIGNFVELKKADVGRGAKINHLSYIGDATVGDKANIGAGTITCNYDGFRKSHTDIGAGAFVGSNSALVAPVKIGDGAFIGAGSVITNDVPADTLAVARGRQSNIDGWAGRMRDDKIKK
ncbi:MAG: bifunctional UDP-N-acetylglucosamine diphosphorylase/glucosamine-1-phosphate N-acetyltransferase GlmU [Alphaproteobacteria bacterium]|nr:bifunctional UDP-N-acetylglucosamine diphosphorylase/glucosamine-1-phosphate N-acetyltransferase GlmU [Alphaproteobacteria bacterium]